MEPAATAEEEATGSSKCQKNLDQMSSVRENPKLKYKVNKVVLARIQTVSCGKLTFSVGVCMQKW